MTTLTNLIERIERFDPRNSVSARMLNVAICQHFSENGFGSMPCEDYALAYTISTDAALGLVGKVLPGWYMMIDGSLMTSFEVSLTDSSVPSAEVREDVSRFFARGKTLPLAILAALLRSKLHTEGKG